MCDEDWIQPESETEELIVIEEQQREKEKLCFKFLLRRALGMACST